MASHSLRILLLGLAPIALTACVEIEPATGPSIATAPLVGVDLGSSGRVPQIAGLAGEGEGYGQTPPAASAMAHGSHGAMDHGSRHGMRHGSTDHGSLHPMRHGSADHGSMHGMKHAKDRGSMPEMSHGSMDHGSMHGMKHGSKDHRSASGMGHQSKDRASGMAHGSAPGTRHGHGEKMAAAQSAGSGKQQGGTQMAHSGHAHVQGTGTVNSVDAAAKKINVTHAPIPKIGWPTMTMDFPVAPSVDLNAVKPGTRIKFEMEQGQDGMYVIQSIAPAGGGR